VLNGTGANVLALRALARPWESVLCAETSHLWVDESGAPEAIAGVKLVTVPAPDGKVRIEDLERKLIRRGDFHFAQPGVLSIANPTEYGTVYTPAETAGLGRWARKNGLRFHVDGSRLVNAAEALGVPLAALTSRAGVDVVSFGGTKNGLLYGEALVFLTPGLSEGFPWLRKQSLQLASKTRFIGAQFEAWLGTGLWRTLARRANGAARRLAAGLRGIPGVELTQPVQTNAVFVRLPSRAREALRRDFRFHVWNAATGECRLMTAWDTTPADVDAFVRAVRRLARPR